jgi:hypothetical protein
MLESYRISSKQGLLDNGNISILIRITATILRLTKGVFGLCPFHILIPSYRS